MRSKSNILIYCTAVGYSPISQFVTSETTAPSVGRYFWRQETDIYTLRFYRQFDWLCIQRSFQGLDFGSSEGLLSGSYKRMNTMVASGKGNRKLMCYITLGLIVTFVILYYIVAKVRAGWSRFEFQSETVITVQNHTIWRCEFQWCAKSLLSWNKTQNNESYRFSMKRAGFFPCFDFVQYLIRTTFSGNLPIARCENSRRARSLVNRSEFGASILMCK